MLGSLADVAAHVDRDDVPDALFRDAVRQDRHTALPPDFPAREALVRAGYDSIEQVRAASDRDLLAVDDIDVATFRRIRSY